MGQVLRIEGEEAVALASELAALTGESLEEAVVKAVRGRVAHAKMERLRDLLGGVQIKPVETPLTPEQAEEERQAWVAAMIEATDRFADLFDHPPPASDHSWLYDDETGLPI